jgi:hypothetical protein
VEWTSDGVRVKGAAEIGSGEVSAVQDAWRRTGGLTAEMWFRLPKEDHPEGFDYVLGQFRVGRHDFRWTSKQAPAEAAGTVNHMVLTWSREGQDVVGRYYSIGIPVITEKYDHLGSELERCPLRYVMGPTELWDKQRLWREYEVMGLAVYGRALTPEEILRNWREVQADPSAGHAAEAPGNGGAQ